MFKTEEAVLEAVVLLLFANENAILVEAHGSSGVITLSSKVCKSLTIGKCELNLDFALEIFKFMVTSREFPVDNTEINTAVIT